MKRSRSAGDGVDDGARTVPAAPVSGFADESDADVASLLRRRLSPLRPLRCELADESARHRGHRGQLETGGGHYRLLLVAEAFSGKSRLERHRLVHSLLADLMCPTAGNMAIHALALQTFAPEEV